MTHSFPPRRFADLAQCDRLVEALKDKAVDAITQPNQAQPASDEPQAKRARLTIDQGFDFTPGTHVVTAIDFGDSAVGSMPPAWKTNGSGQKIGKASCRERVCQYVWISVVAQ